MSKEEEEERIITRDDFDARGFHEDLHYESRFVCVRSRERERDERENVPHLCHSGRYKNR